MSPIIPSHALASPAFVSTASLTSTETNPTASRRKRGRKTRKPSRKSQQDDRYPAARPETPVPLDALPSVKATSSARKQARIEYTARFSHLDRRSDHHDFRGFFVLFWIGLAIMVITNMLRSYKETGTFFMISQWPLFIENLWELALSDFLMTLSLYVCLPLQRLFLRSKHFRWRFKGMITQSLYQVVWLAHWVVWPFVRTWTWTAQVFFILHVLCLLMKMHSYAFYNGHLSETRRRLQSLDQPDVNPSRKAVVRYPRAGIQEINLDSEPLDEPATTSSKDLITRKHAENKIQESDDSNGSKKSLDGLRQDLADELTSQIGNVTYPDNLNWSNFTDFLFCPTLCYGLEYPRTEAIEWKELSYKILAIFGCIFLLIFTSEEFILPVLAESAAKLHSITSFNERALIFAETTSRLMFPFMVSFLLVFLVIFEYILGAFAEITRFADRRFYSDWWNSADWLEFSREWNIPVHQFLSQHVYLASGGYLSRGWATAITFLVSALAHELILGCIAKKLRGYGFVMLMLQIPFFGIQHYWLREQKLLNNVIFWCSMIVGSSIICALYVLI